MNIAFLASLLFGVLGSVMALLFTAGLWNATTAKNIEKEKTAYAKDTKLSDDYVKRVSALKFYELMVRRSAVARYARALVSTLGMTGAAFGFASTYRFETATNRLGELALVASTIGTLASVIFLAIYNRNSSQQIDKEIQELELRAEELKRAGKP